MYLNLCFLCVLKKKFAEYLLDFLDMQLIFSAIKVLVRTLEPAVIKWYLAFQNQKKKDASDFCRFF